MVNNQPPVNLTASLKVNTNKTQIEITLDQKYDVNTSMALRLEFHSILETIEVMNGFYMSTYTPKGSVK